ncbi:retrovirus-related pol polyprotein from transposon TNT 1-94 [Tanacetum coccineum]
MTVAGTRETVGSQVMQQTGIQCFNCKGYGHYAKECRKPKRTEPMLIGYEENWMKRLYERNWKHITEHGKDSGPVSPDESSSTGSAIGTGSKIMMLKFLNEIVYISYRVNQTIHIVSTQLRDIMMVDNLCHPRLAPDRKRTMTLDNESRSKLKKDYVEIVDQTWFKHTSDYFRVPTAHDMELLIKTLLMPLSIKSQNDSFRFEHELKTEMHEDFEYVKSLENEVDELESEKADFSNMYDLLIEECVSKDVTCSYLHSLSDLNAHTELQCLYLHKVKECECLAIKLSKQTESVNKEVHNNLLKSFSKLEKHSISLELALQQCKEHMKNNSVCKENGSNVFRKEREQYHEIQDLKAQMQDKNIAISELKKLIENCKGKSVETQFDKPSVVRQPNAQRIPKPSVLGKPTPFSNSPEMRSFQTKQSVNKTNVSDGLFKQVTQQNLPKIRKQAVRNTNVIAPGPSRNHPKHLSFQSPKEFVGSNYMVHNYYLEKAKKSAQLQKDRDVNGKPSMINPARLPNTANGCKPKPRNWQASMSSRVSNKDVHIEGEHRKQKPFLKSNDLRCPTCKKCLFSANHDECVLEYLSKLNPRASAQNKDAKSHKTTKRYMPVEKTRESKRPERQIPSGHRFSKKKTTTVPEKTMTPRSCLRWKQTGKIFKTVDLRWVPTGKLFNSCTGKVDSEPTHGLIVDNPHIHACKQTLGLSAGTSFNGQKQQRINLNADALYNAPFLNVQMTSVHISSGLVLHQMTSDHNRSELGILVHSNEPSSSKLVPKVVPTCKYY